MAQHARLWALFMAKLKGQSVKSKQVPKHEMTLRSHKKNEVNTFFGVQNDLYTETKFRLHDKSLERQLHLDSNFFVPMFKWSENSRDKSLLSRKEKILTRLASSNKNDSKH